MRRGGCGRSGTGPCSSTPRKGPLRPPASASPPGRRRSGALGSAGLVDHHVQDRRLLAPAVSGQLGAALLGLGGLLAHLPQLRRQVGVGRSGPRPSRLPRPAPPPECSALPCRPPVSNADRHYRVRFSLHQRPWPSCAACETAARSGSCAPGQRHSSAGPCWAGARATSRGLPGAARRQARSGRS